MQATLTFFTIVALCTSLSFSLPHSQRQIMKRNEIRTTSNDVQPHSYIVKLKDDVSKDVHLTWLNNYLGNDSTVQHGKWDSNVFHGFSGSFKGEALEQLQGSEDIEYILQDSIMRTTETLTQVNAPWGISRLSLGEKQPSTDDTSLSFFYTFDSSAGQGVDVYVVDTGINTEHLDFGGRASWGATFGNNPDEDDNGHGSHCAGIIGGDRFGVAKNVSLFAVKVLDKNGAGASSDIISGINFAVNQAHATQRPSIISMSLGGSEDPALDAAVSNAVVQGVHVVVAAGNDGHDATQNSPARVEIAITVGASNIDDERTSFSNFGSVVDVYAPGQSVTSTFIGSNAATKVLDGTSMAAPHVSGLIAYLLSLEGNSDPGAVSNRIRALARGGILSNIPQDTTNELASNGFSL